ncbi:unnamed protein product [Fusarium graminearum]|uniref:Chromosome 1, complete genome n=2 Tax=Gibberella zeae TaxID=5518 RepID=A0A098D7L4_GIBZE|nr:unnamed protein product [Fusarium graminearum]CAF3454796.1 unnamed protein product [Fusarium graminearum]CAF3582577.1 unnamed protein product [Fusarium graminearum]CAG1961176.1 unnamed protein product [Fusarium graminearum]CAG1967580.1 unnamed protein product [Fusarium graminearum]
MLWRVSVPLDGNAPTFCDADTSYGCLMAPHFVIKGGLLWLHRSNPPWLHVLHRCATDLGSVDLWTAAPAKRAKLGAVSGPLTP